MKTKTQQYTATFTLSQDGTNGPVKSTLVFDPLIENAEDAPAAFEIMAHLVREYLFITDIIDEDGNLVDPDDFHANATIIASSGGQGKLN